LLEAGDSGDWPPEFKFPKLTGEIYSPEGVFKDVQIKPDFKGMLSMYAPVKEQSYPVSKMVVTNKRIIFLDKSTPPKLLSWEVWLHRLPARPGAPAGQQGPIRKYGLSHRNLDPRDIGPFWILKRSGNEDMHRELIGNQAAFSKERARKAPGAWWFQGYRDWTWVSNFNICTSVSSSGSNSLRFELTTVVELGPIGVGRSVPVSYREGDAVLTVDSLPDAKSLYKYLQENVKPDLGPPFNSDYIASLPNKPLTGGWLLYYYVFWVGLTAMILYVLLPKFGLPPLLTDILLVAGCYAVFRYLGLRRDRAARSAAREPTKTT
jgi:hypothetical protein